MNPRERTVSKTFRDEIYKIYPELQHQPYAELFCYLCFGTAKDDSYGNLLIPSKTLASFEKKQSYLESKNYNAEKFLLKFQNATSLKVEVSGYYSPANYCRTVKKFSLPDDVAALVEKERRNMWIKQDRVYFVDGRKYNPKIQREYYKMDQLEANELIAALEGNDGLCVMEPQKIGHYLNNLPANRFSKINAYLQEAIEFSQQMPGSNNKHGRDNTEEVRRHNLNILTAIADQPQPFYQPSEAGKTVRLFTLNQSLLALSKNVRKILTQDWHEADLRSSQLAIVAQQWNIPYIKEFLKSEQSVWRYFCEDLNIEYSDSHKALLKTALYSTIFGMKVHEVSNRLNRGLKSQNIGKKFIKCKLVQELTKAREKKIQQVLNDGGCQSCYGWLDLNKFDILDSVNSLLSQCAQATEMSIVYSAFDLAFRDPHFHILLFQHDGFSFVIDDKRQKDYYTELLKQLIKTKCDQLEIESSLEIIN